MNSTAASIDTELCAHADLTFALTYLAGLTTHNEEGGIEHTPLLTACTVAVLNRGDLTADQIRETLTNLEPGDALHWADTHPEHLEHLDLNGEQLFVAFDSVWADTLERDEALVLHDHTWEHLCTHGDINALLVWAEAAPQWVCERIYARAAVELGVGPLLTAETSSTGALDALLNWSRQHHTELYHHTLTAAVSGRYGEVGTEIPVTDDELKLWMCELAPALCADGQDLSEHIAHLTNVIGWRCANTLNSCETTTLEQLDDHAMAHHHVFQLCARFSPGWWASEPPTVKLCAQAGTTTNPEDHTALIALLTDALNADAGSASDTDDALNNDAERIAAAAYRCGTNPALSGEHQIELLRLTATNHLYHPVHRGLSQRKLRVDVACELYLTRHRQPYVSTRELCEDPEKFTDAVLQCPGSLDETEQTLYEVLHAGHFDDRHINLVRCDAVWAVTRSGAHPELAQLARTHLLSLLDTINPHVAARLLNELADDYPGTLQDLADTINATQH